MTPILSYAAKHGALTFFFLLLLSPAISPVGAQPTPEPYPYQRLNPSATIDVVVLVLSVVVLFAALFLMCLYCIYTGYSSDAQSASIRAGGTHTGRSRGGASSGLDAAVIDTFPTLEYSAVKGLKIGKGALECAVCLNEFEDGKRLRLIPKCDHVFHPECIDDWLASKTTCPVCRANLVPQPGDPIPQLTVLNSEHVPVVDVEAQNDAVESAPETDEGCQETVDS